MEGKTQWSKSLILSFCEENRSGTLSVALLNTLMQGFESSSCFYTNFHFLHNWETSLEVSFLKNAPKSKQYKFCFPFGFSYGFRIESIQWIHYKDLFAIVLVISNNPQNFHEFKWFTNSNWVLTISNWWCLHLHYNDLFGAFYSTPFLISNITLWCFAFWRFKTLCISQLLLCHSYKVEFHYYWSNHSNWILFYIYTLCWWNILIKSNSFIFMFPLVNLLYTFKQSFYDNYHFC